jgi:predicted TIM-barrel fold metal-dependent hydrolase
MICGPDISYNNPPALDRFLALFPDLTVVMCHGGYPYVSEICCLMAKHVNFYVVPDVYFFHPGAQGYQMNLNLLPEQFLYGSGYPFSSMKESVEDTIALLDSPIGKVRPEVMENYLYNNAARLLKIEN